MLNNVIGLFVSNPITCLHSYCGGFCPAGSPATSKHFEVALLQTLLTSRSSTLGISESLHRTLILPKHVNGKDTWEQEDQLNEDAVGIPFCGLPSAPYYKELAIRIYSLYEFELSNYKQNVVTNQEKYLLIPAESLGFQEQALPMIDTVPRVTSPPTTTSLSKWLRDAGDEGILRILGMRRTVGTDPRGLLPPQKTALLAAASAIYKKGQHSKFSVAAKARSKHAHRGKEQFFGIVKGSAEKQSIETEAIVINILNCAAWINIHSFAGTHQPVLESRLESGYGARWTADWTDQSRPVEVKFRGFLEPQMQDGHEKNWRH